MNYLSEESDLQLHDNTVLYFYTSWMPFNERMDILLNKMESKYKRKVYFNAIDADYFKGLCKRFCVTSVPTVIMMKKFDEVNRVVGIVLTSAMKSEFIKTYEEQE